VCRKKISVNGFETDDDIEKFRATHTAHKLGGWGTARWSSRISLVHVFERNVTKFAPRQALKYIA